MFVVIANRDAGSMLGAASQPCKNNDGSIKQYETSEEAVAEAERLNDRVTSRHVWYTVQADHWD
jgi:hypothetical protein